MGKNRKTREQKIKSSQRAEIKSAFSVQEGWHVKTDKSANSVNVASLNDMKYFKADLTKTLFLTMLVLALELALWQILTRQ